MATAWPSPLIQATEAAAGGNPLTPYANARLLQYQNLIPGDVDSPMLWRHVFECFLRRGNYITAKENGPGVDTGDFTYSGFICRASRLPMESTDPLDWLSTSLPWQQDNLRVATRAEGTVQVPCKGLIWLGDLSRLTDPPDSEADPRRVYTAFDVIEFGASYGSGGIGAITQPLVGERIYGTMKLHQLPDATSGALWARQ
ncbi:MAG: hypothetical protein FJ076_00050 [Cyanobacteria bacterium K_DeepCast_35m_m1_288]|jgi:hypothetical protein|nr:hypothetical protein [Cyanobacteria bacterium K_DeepCast_35m_m1_288]